MKSETLQPTSSGSGEVGLPAPWSGQSILSRECIIFTWKPVPRYTFSSVPLLKNSTMNWVLDPGSSKQPSTIAKILEPSSPSSVKRVPWDSYIKELGSHPHPPEMCTHTRSHGGLTGPKSLTALDQDSIPGILRFVQELKLISLPQEAAQRPGM